MTTQQLSTPPSAKPRTGNGSAPTAYMVGGGIGSLAAAAFLIRDGKVPGRNITIYEAMPVLGGSLDGNGSPKNGYTMRGGRMLTTDNYECTWDLFKSIPSLSSPNQTVFDETIAFNKLHQSHSQARLIDRHRANLDVQSMGFSMQDRIELLKLTETDEEKLGTSCITDWLSPPFFTTDFWFMWTAVYAYAVSFAVLKTGLAAGSHSFKLQWKVSTGTGRIYCGSSSGALNIAQFWVREVS